MDVRLSVSTTFSFAYVMRGTTAPSLRSGRRRGQLAQQEHQAIRLDRLGEMRVEPRLARARDVLGAAEARHRDQPEGAVAVRGAQSPGHLEAVDAREADVADDGEHVRPLQPRARATRKLVTGGAHGREGTRPQRDGQVAIGYHARAVRGSARQCEVSPRRAEPEES